MLYSVFFSHQKQQILQIHMHKKNIIAGDGKYLYSNERTTHRTTERPTKRANEEKNMAFAAVSYTPDYRIHR